MTTDNMMMEPLKREPAWLTAAVDQQVQLVKSKLAFVKTVLPEVEVVMLMLNEDQTQGMTESQFMEWNEMCDGCRKQFPNSEGLLFAHVFREWSGTAKACITFAACIDCLALP